MKVEFLKESFGALYKLLLDDDISEIMIDSPERVYYEKNGELLDFNEQIQGDSQLQKMAESIEKITEKSFDSESSTLRFNIGNLIGIICSPRITNDCYTFVIRKKHVFFHKLDQLVTWKALEDKSYDILKSAINNHKSILFAGGVGSGVNTLLNCGLNEIDERCRVVTVEKSPWIYTNRKRVSSLSAPSAKASELATLLDTAYHLRGDYVILGEVYGKEAFNYVEMLRDGYSGMTTIRASNIYDAVNRLEKKVLTNTDASLDDAQYAISEAFDLVVYQERKNDGSRKVTRIAEIDSVNNKLSLNILYKRD